MANPRPNRWTAQPHLEKGLWGLKYATVLCCLMAMVPIVSGILNPVLIPYSSKNLASNDIADGCGDVKDIPWSWDAIGSQAGSLQTSRDRKFERADSHKPCSVLKYHGADSGVERCEAGAEPQPIVGGTNIVE
ncbi:hypothetical protein BKA56DRAFT_692867 [Ilyonectria sp. MPI-CAGE-AT-0026]|nr:hypothetical protein BKA56DRAFT_692867 [Ilyonectria sp. MPI-CAGE-AT-0026]